jgi:hypothetical protein
LAIWTIHDGYQAHLAVLPAVAAQAATGQTVKRGKT